MMGNHFFVNEGLKLSFIDRATDLVHLHAGWTQFWPDSLKVLSGPMGPEEKNNEN
jgi:hypothetical protein